MNVAGGLPILKFCELVPRQRDNGTRSKSVQAIKEAIKTLPGKPNIILIILSNADKHIYAGIKHLCDVILDVPSVCVQAGKFKKGGVSIQSSESISAC